MFVGHFAVALGAKKVEPRLPLALLTAAAFGLDVLWPIFLLTGLEAVRIEPGNTRFTPFDFQSYPWSHSLVMSLVWGALAGVLVARRLGSTRAGALVAAVVFSHWPLDWITHRPDLPLWPQGPRVGLGLWNSIAGTIAIEGLVYAVGIASYLRATSARDATGRWAFWGLVAVTAAVWLSGPFSPPPPSVSAVIATMFVMFVVVIVWVRWIEQHRRLRSATS